jgi:hypothetical protein
MKLFTLTTAVMFITAVVDILYPSDLAMTAMFVAILVWIITSNY